MKRALTNVVIGEQARLFQLTGRRMMDYAREIGAKHILHTHTKYDPPQFAKFGVLRRALNQGYDQVLFLDIDIYVKPDAPNIFNHYTNAVFSEIPHPLAPALQPSIAWIRENLDPLWSADCYFNTGVMVMEAETIVKVLELFDEMGPRPGKFFEQDQLNYIMHQVGFPAQRLDIKWNQGLRPEWVTPTRLDEANFLHANGVEDKFRTLDQIKQRYG